MSGLHKKLLRVVKRLPTDYKPYGKRDRTEKPKIWPIDL